jgi:histidine triad (HIT) family protein
MSDGCVFCMIIDKKIPSAVLHEDDLVVAFADISPQAPTHLLIVPRAHVPGLNDVTEAHSALLARVPLVARGLAARMGLAEGGWRLVCNCGPDAGQTVAHLHFHLLGGAPMSGRMA